MKRFVYLLLLLGVFPACRDNQTDVEKGVSKALATERKSMIGSVTYDLYFSIPEEREDAIMAESVISFELLKQTPVILDFKADPQQILSITSDGKKIPYSFKNEHIIIKPSCLVEGRNKLYIRFIAGESSLNRNDEFLYTLLVPDRCRTLMPCFDQPDIKGRFRLKLKVPAGWKGVGNGEPLRRESFAHYNLYEFEVTKPLSTYLFAFAAGKFNYTRQYNGGRWIGVFHRETDTTKIKHSIPAIAEQVGYSLRWMERYTGIRYPFNIYNVVAIPDFQYGGMEHPGATYYRSSLLFLAPEAELTAQIRRSELIAHETAHMWFGDLVTMKWFDDVWLKEVFAGLMADKIISGLYPGVDHKLNFYLNHYEPSLRTDRTRGAHPVLQELNNLQNAGTLYGDIIYHKAPIVMKILENEISPEGLRLGLVRYLANWQYSNADFDDLLKILENATQRELQHWKKIWLETAGAPVVEYAEEGVYMKDTEGEEKVWPQTVLNLTSGMSPFNRKRITLQEPFTELSTQEIILGDCEAWGYGSFLPTESGMRFLFDQMNQLPSLQRAIAWQTLFNGVLHKKYKAELFIRMCIKHLPNETNNLIINRTLSFFSTVFHTYLDEGSRQLLIDETERFFITILFKNQPKLHKKPFFRTLLSLYTSGDTGNYFYKVLTGQIRRDDLVLTDDDRLTIAYNLVLRNPGRYDRMKRYIHRTIKNPDLLKRFDFVYPALSGEKETRDSVFQALLLPENRGNEVWSADALQWLNHPKRKMEAEEYIPQILNKLQEIQMTGDIFFPSEWLRAGLSCHTSKYAYTTVCNFLAKHPNYPENLKLKILMHTDHLRRLHTE